MHGIDLGGSHGRIAWQADHEVVVADPADSRSGWVSARFTAAENAAARLDRLLRLAESYGSEPPRDVVLPTSLLAPRDRALRRAVEERGLRVALSLPEPVAVVVHYGAVVDGGRSVLIVCDQGATRTELTLVRVGAERTVWIEETVVVPVGGDTWDAAIARQLSAQLNPGLLGAQRDQQIELAPLAGTLRREVDRSGTAVRREIRQGGSDAVVELDPASLSRLLDPLRRQTVDAALALRDRARARSGEEPTALLLAGGLSETPGTAELFEERLGIYVRTQDPRSAAARGLVLAPGLGLLRVRQADQDQDRPSGPGPTRAQDPEPPAPTVPDPEPPGPAATHPPRRAQPPQPSERPVTPEPPRPAPQPQPQDLPPRPERETPPQPCGQAPPPVAEPAPDSRDDGRSGLVGCPVGDLQAVRRGNHLLVLWVWPQESLSATVRWHLDSSPSAPAQPGSGEAVCSRRVYEYDGGFELALGPGAVTLTVEALAPAQDPDWSQEPSSVHLPAELPLVSYEPRVRRWGRLASVSFSSDSPCRLPALNVVHAVGGYRPTSPSDGTVLMEVPAQPLRPGLPLVVEFPFPPTRSTSWLVCFPVHEEVEDVDLRPTALSRLRVT
ncbi:hypothetical protein [Streptomyces sp. RKAG293]|uniref:hypothetical protein n=1 Tax=Streptomyces sp. RKAG293 TaxID=2893403 RepID=UPI0020345804|nr:hypothetical protein [Streptomyces sp. RKAG293]MCM2422615.1 hypothetical protein [Streptomyces sp. RKAG293]